MCRGRSATPRSSISSGATELELPPDPAVEALAERIRRGEEAPAPAAKVAPPSQTTLTWAEYRFRAGRGAITRAGSELRSSQLPAPAPDS